MKRSLYILPLVAGLSACGGSDGGDAITPTTPLAKVISGELTGKDSEFIFINTQKIEIGNATVSPSNTRAQLNVASLQVGMQLTVSTDGKTAEKIIFDSLMTAKVIDLNPTDKSLNLA